MTPPRPSVSPLPSFCVVPLRSAPPLAETLRQVIAWLRGDKPSFRQRIAEAKLIEKLSAELEEQEIAAKAAEHAEHKDER